MVKHSRLVEFSDPGEFLAVMYRVMMGVITRSLIQYPFQDNDHFKLVLFT